MANSFIKKTREEKKKEIEKLTAELDDQVRKIFNSDEYKKYLKTMAKFHNYSFNNSVLISLQCPDASLVASYVSWKRNFHRNVKKGEKGIKIFAPAPIKKEAEVEKLDPVTNKRILNDNGDPIMETVEMTIPMFKIVYVYDYQQTEGEPLPTIGVDELTSNVPDYKKYISAIEKISPVPIYYENVPGAAKGFYSLSEKKIVVQSGMSESQTLKTLCHECVHSLIHDDTGPKVEGIAEDKKTRNTKEVEAEGASFVVMSYFNLDEKVGEYSFPYISSWSSDKKLEELKASMETIRRTASHIITGIEEQLMEKPIIKEELSKEITPNAERSLHIKSTKSRKVPELE